MRLSHDEIREMIPEYLRGALSADRRVCFENHLSGCKDCRSELSLITELSKEEVPDPGELYFMTLPQKVKIAVKEETKGFSLRALLFRFSPAAAAIVTLLLLTIALTYIKKKESPEFDPYFKDPLMIGVLDYSGVTERDIPLGEERIAIDESFVYPENSFGYSYYREFASLSSEEMESLYEALKKEEKSGG